MSVERLRLQDGQNWAEIDPKGAYVGAIIFKDFEVLKPSHDGVDTHGGMALMLPFAGRVKQAKYVWNDKEYLLPKNNGRHSIHGLTRDLTWEILNRSENSVTLSLTLSHDAYPAPVTFTVSYSISRTNFTIDISAHNEGKLPVPVVAGMHPYFSFKDGWAIESQRTFLRLNFEDDYFPDGTVSPVNPQSLNSQSSIKFDNAYIVADSLKIKNGKGSVCINTVNMPFLVVYNGEYSEGSSVAVEPMSGAPDAFNNGIGLVSVKPGCTFRCGAVFEFSYSST